MGKAPAHRTIQFIGTPPRRLALALSKRRRERGWGASKRWRSSARRPLSRERSMGMVEAAHLNAVRTSARIARIRREENLSCQRGERARVRGRLALDVSKFIDILPRV